jgi:5'(3')-deoxyribonucleotidase
MDDTNAEKRIVYFDMDGVLADFDGHFYKLFGKTTDIGDDALWKLIESYGKARFFSELPWMPGSKEMFRFAYNNFLQVKILSALGRSDKVDGQTTKGKLTWLRHNIPELQMDDIILVPNKHKKRHYSKPGDIIIDDNETVIQEWTRKGGIAIFHKTALETIETLKKYV